MLENSKPESKESQKIKIFLIIYFLLIIIFIFIFCFRQANQLTVSYQINWESFKKILPTYQDNQSSLENNISKGIVIKHFKEKWWRVMFTTPKELYKPDIIQGSIAEQFVLLIQSSKSEIHIAGFEANHIPIADALIDAKKRGVNIIWITDDEYGLEEDIIEKNGFFSKLIEAGIEVECDNRSALMHNKFAVFDKSIVWTGSTNFTKNGNFRNNNNALWLRSYALAQIYENEFMEMLNGKFGPSSPSLQKIQSTIIDDSRIQVLYGSEDDTIDGINFYLQQAKDNIVFMTFSFTLDEIGEVLKNKISENVLVAGIFETRGSETIYSEMNSLFCANGYVRQDGNKRTMHHKVFIIDGEIVITGSLNFSENATKNNDENVIIIKNTEIAQEYLKEFERLWVEAFIPNDIICE